MIFDRLENLNSYGFDLHFIVDDLQKGRFEKGKYEISGKEQFGIDLIYSTQEQSKALWEAHRKYLDIHIVLEGEEFIHISDIKTMISSREYEDDYELFEGYAQHSIYLKPGYFLVLFPYEVHRTCIKVNESVIVKKKVYKMALED